MRRATQHLRPGNETRELYERARRIRRTLCDWFEASPPGRIVLVPGILGALQILFARLRVGRIMLSEGEYYGALHFPAQQVAISSLDKLLEKTKRFRPDAIILSVVTWRGDPLPCARLFSELRRWRGQRRTPLLVADYCHAGAVGFPSVRTLVADVVCGGAAKWITPPLRDSRLSFLWFGSGRLFSRAKVAFMPFFLATDHKPSFLVSRWMDPAEIRALDAWLAHRRLRRAALLAQYHRDREFTTRLAARFGVDCPSSNILLLSRDHSRDKRVRDLERLGLAWKLPEGRTRVLCRASAEGSG